MFSLRVLFRALRRSWWVVLLSVGLALAAAAVVTLKSAPQYASSVTFFVRTPAEQISGAYQGDQFAQKRVNSYAQLASSLRLAELIKDDTQLGLSADAISQRISAKGDLNTVLLTLSVVDSDPARSLDIADSISRQFVALVSQLETPPGASVPSVSLEITSPATLQEKPVSPRPLMNYSIALVLGLFLGVLIALVRELLDNSVRNLDTLKEVAGPSVLAVVPFDDSARMSPLIVDSHARSVRAEALRQLRTNLQFVDVDAPIGVVVVTSSVPDEGKSSSATNLALAFAEAGRTVLLIEGDLRRPRVAEYLGLEGGVGLTNVLAGQVEIDDVLQPWGRGGMTVLPCGSIPPNPSELLNSQNMQDLLAELRNRFELVIIDTPPLLPVTDAAIAAANSDGAILVVRYGCTTRNQVATSVAALESVDARLLGTVLNMVPGRGVDGYYYGSYDYREEESRDRGQAVEVSSSVGLPDGRPTQKV